MFGLRTILHPTDFSATSGHAFAAACALAHDYGAQLVLLYVTAPQSVAGQAALLPLLREHDLDLRKQLHQLTVPPGVPRPIYRLEHGDPATEVVRVAQETAADLIVLGTHGRTGLGRVLLGSVAETVLRQAPCPVLTVRAPLPADARAKAAQPAEAPAPPAPTE
jgi:nucleotide-binding universal stress UspA family protein